PLRLKATTLRETYHKTIMPIPCVIDGLVYHGLTVCAGPPKVGKSYLAADLVLSVATGKPALGALAVESPGKVLYLCLEDGERRFRNRVRKMVRTDEDLDDIEVVYELPAPLSQPEGLRALEERLASGGYELVIIDTFVKAFSDEVKTNDIFRAQYRTMDAL